MKKKSDYRKAGILKKAGFKYIVKNHEWRFDYNMDRKDKVKISFSACISMSRVSGDSVRSLRDFVKSVTDVSKIKVGVNVKL